MKKAKVKSNKKASSLADKFPGISKEPDIISEDGMVLKSESQIVENCPHTLTGKQVSFLTHYSTTMDMNEAIKMAGYRDASTSKKNLLNNPWIKAEVDEIDRRYRLQWKLNANMTAAKHIELMEKMEKMMDDGNDKVANPLAKMSEVALKATGQLDRDVGTQAVPVTVNINIGKKTEDVVVEAEVSHDD